MTAALSAMPATVPDCSLDGAPIPLSALPTLTSTQLARIVGDQEPGGVPEQARDYFWAFERVPLERLRNCNEDGEEPGGGWSAAHLRHLKADAEAVAGHSPEYAGRDAWLRDVWCKNTSVYPLFIVREEESYRLWDGYRRLASAFHYGLTEVAVLVGTPR